MARAAYEIRAVGEVPKELLEDFDVVTVHVDPAGTTIHAHLADDAELSGLLEAIARGGFVLVEVHREVFEDPDDERDAHRTSDGSTTGRDTPGPPDAPSP